MSADPKLDDLVKRMKPGPVVPFLGAAVNVGLVPLWPQLLDEMLDYALTLRLGTQYDRAALTEAKNTLAGTPSLFTVYDQANLVKTLLGNRYLSVLRHVIYDKYNNSDEKYYEGEAVETLGFLGAVIQLCRNDRIKAVVTYNYDDILLKALNGRNAYPVCGQRQPSYKEGGLPIYYMHGFLPNREHPPENATAKVVLSLDEYFHNMMEPFSWQTTTQLHFLRNANCIFLGTSLSDINMLRMLSHSKEYAGEGSVFALMAEADLQPEAVANVVAGLKRQGKDKEAKAIAELVARSKATLLHEVGVELIVLKEYDQLYSLVRKLGTHLKSSNGATK